MSDYQDKVAEVHTSKGEIHIRFFPDVAPNHVKNFIDLAGKGFYDGTKFHRVIPGFMIQGGDPNTKSGDTSTWGTGGAEKRLQAEFSPVPHRRGIVSMARSQDPNSASSQFFIVVADSQFLDNQYTVFGQVTKGMDVADAIVNAPRGPNDRPNDPVTIKSITIRPATAAESGPAPR
ncbi:MAG TPA: peptidylprolyl isomerase [Thermoanaerobaculia bacterium]|nr:peptidylprolyl isomerase [Thermoanaerobaculia bacterium]